MKEILVFLIVFTSLAFPKLFNIDLSIILIIIYLLVNIKQIRIDRVIVYFFFCFGFVFFIAFMNYLLYFEIFGLLRTLNTYLVFLLTYIFLQNSNIYSIKKYIIITFSIAMLIIILEYVNIYDSKEIITNLNNLFYTTKDVLYRARGLYPGYASAGLMTGIASIFFFIYAYKEKKNYLFILSVILLITTIITSRTGFLIASMGIISIIIYISYLKISFINVIKYVFLISFLMFLLYEVVSPYLDIEILSITLNRFLELYNNYHETGSVSSNSTSELFNSYYLPPNIVPFLFGKNLQPWVLNGVKSDVGFIQTWHQFGLIGMLIFYTPFFSLIIIKLLVLIKNAKLPLLLYISIIFDILIILSNFKGNYIYSKGVIFITLYLHVISVKIYNKKGLKI